MKLFIMRVLTCVALKGRFYYTWSKIYRWLWERKWRYVDIPIYKSFTEITEVVGKMQWRRDGYRELWDAVSTPYATYGKFLAGKKVGDCDDISLFAGYCINKANAATLLQKPMWKIGLLSCPWLDRKNKVGGHNVCAFAYQEPNGDIKWGHISNWYRGYFRWGFPSLIDVVRSILSEKKAISLGWAFASLDLKLREYHWNTN